MTFVQPMLAFPQRGKDIITPGEWIAEEKFDGHRVIVAVTDAPDLLFNSRGVRAWSRDGAERFLPPHVRAFCELLPTGVYDGELIVPGGGSHNVTELTRRDELQYVVFDVLQILGKSAMECTWAERQLLLDQAIRSRCLDPNHNGDEAGVANDRGCGNARCFNSGKNPRVQSVICAEPWEIADETSVAKLRDVVWARGGEGLMLKRKSSRYLPGKRSRDWLKIKKFLTQVVSIIGYRAGRLGPQATVVVRDGEGYETTVKTLNDKERLKLEADPKKFLGKRLVIEYQQRTGDGSYRHPRWDRWAEDHE